MAEPVVHVVYEPKRKSGPGWLRRVLVEGEPFWCEVYSAGRARIPYARRGQRMWGHDWRAAVWRHGDRRKTELGSVFRDVSPVVLLKAAGVLEPEQPVSISVLRSAPAQQA